MIEFKTGDLLNADVEALVNTVNCVGVMGRGIALQFKKMFPENFRAYDRACKNGEVITGKMNVFETKSLTNPKYIINFPTKRHWRGNSKLEDIETGLIALRQEIIDRNIHSIAIPPLGSGLGGLSWPTVKELIIDFLGSLEDTKITVFEPHAKSDKMKRHLSRTAPKLTPYRAALVSLMDRYLRGLMEPYVSLLEIHKLAYFLQHSGMPMRLRFVKGHYGPYAENLRHVLIEMEGYYTSGYGDGGDQPEKPITLVPKSVEESENLLASDIDVGSKFNRIQELIRGFETPLGLELLATSHWAITSEGANSISSVNEVFKHWNSRKSMFTDRQIKIAVDQLSEKGWIESTFER